MGFENLADNLLVLKNRQEFIEICPSKTKNNDETKTISIEYLFSSILLKNNCNVPIDITKIKVLELSHCHLADIPIGCKNLNLKHLGLAHNELTSIPSCLYTGLKYLESLDLSHNKITVFDMEPECLPYVKKIKLNNNKLKNIPKWFLMFKSVNLEEFNYSNNEAKNYKFLKNSYNMNINKVKKLKLRNCYLLDEDHNFLKCFKLLQYLDISNKHKQFLNKFRELDELFVKPQWKQMKVLKLNNLSLSLFPEGIAWIESLTELHINNNFISWLPDGIEFMVNLEFLDISQNMIICIPETITKIVGLKILRASENAIETVPDFTRMQNLNVLDLYDNLLDNVSFDFNQFIHIDLENNYLDSQCFSDVCSYEYLKDSYRKMHSLNRIDGLKLRNCYSPLSSTRSYSSDDEFRSAYDTTIKRTSNFHIDENEDWDSPAKASQKNPQIDSADDEWQDDDRDLTSKLRQTKEERVYVADEDWMFVDVEDYL